MPVEEEHQKSGNEAGTVREETPKGNRGTRKRGKEEGEEGRGELWRRRP